METIEGIDGLIQHIENFAPDTYQIGSRTSHKKYSSIAKGQVDNTIEIGGEVLTCIGVEEITDDDDILTVKCMYSHSGELVDLIIYKKETELEDEF